MIKPLPACAALALLLCSSAFAVTAGPSDLVSQAQTLMLRGDYADAAQLYAQAAASAPQGFAADFWLLAAEAALLGNNPAHADELLASVPQSGLDAHQTARLELLHARVDVARGNYAAAAQALPAEPQDAVLADSMLLLRARALSQIGDPVGATASLVRREAFLSGSSLQNNRAAIWAGLNVAPMAALTGERIAQVDEVTRGWIELARLSRTSASLQAYQDWQRRYPQHPATDRAQRLIALASPATPAAAAATTPPAAATAAPAPALPPPAPTPAAAAPQAAAVATGVSSPAAVASMPATAVPATPGPGTAAVATTTTAPPAAATPAMPSAASSTATVAGTATPLWIAPWGYSAAAEGSMTSVPAGSGPIALLVPEMGPLALAGNTIRDSFTAAQAASVYNVSGSAQETLDTYTRALNDGAGIIVGPLRKESASAIVGSVPEGGSLPVPVISLNYLDASLHAPAGLIQFGLAPEDEAQSAAADAAARGLRRAVVLVPDDDWGGRIAAAFRQRFQFFGGVVVDEARYAAGTADFSAPIKSLLKLDAGEARDHALTGVLHLKLEYEPRRRDDVDMVFLGARAAQARLITPQFRYYRADHLPIYGTSSVYDGTVDADLNGVRFCDVPSLIAGTAPVGRSADLVRLDALGHDAALLAKALHVGPLTPATTFDGASGRIIIDGAGVVHRALACAEIDDGAVHALSTPRSPPP